MDRIRRIAGHLMPTLDDASSAPSDRVSAHLQLGGVAASACSAKPVKRVLITGAAGQIGYSLVFNVAAGLMLGSCQPVILHLLDIPQCEPMLKGVVMELQDCAFPLLKGVVATTDIKTAFTDVDVALLVGARPRSKGMERADLLKANVGIFKEQGQALNQYASRNVKVCVVGNPANTNCYIAMKYAPNIPKENFSALTRLDQNRAVAMLADRLRVDVTRVRNVVIWGNHSSTQFPDLSVATVASECGGRSTAASAALNDEKWYVETFIPAVQQRGAAVIAARKASSAASAAKAICDHVHDWLLGTAEGQIVSMAVASDGSYGIQRDLIYSFPVTCVAGRWRIVEGLSLSPFSKKMMSATEQELVQERDAALEFTK